MSVNAADRQQVSGRCRSAGSLGSWLVLMRHRERNQTSDLRRKYTWAQKTNTWGLVKTIAVRERFLYVLLAEDVSTKVCASA